MNAGEREGLRRLAELATPGPWKSYDDGITDGVVGNPGVVAALFSDEADERYVAAANPAAVIELLDALEAAERKVAAVERLADEWARVGRHDRAAKRAHEKLRAALAAEDADGGAS